MEKQCDTRKEIDMFSELLGFDMDETRRENLLPAYEDMLYKSTRVDRKMSKKPYVDLVPGNIYIH